MRARGWERLAAERCGRRHTKPRGAVLAWRSGAVRGREEERVRCACVHTRGGGCVRGGHPSLESRGADAL
jgi:hypothetical protein